MDMVPMKARGTVFCQVLSWISDIYDLQDVNLHAYQWGSDPTEIRVHHAIPATPTGPGYENSTTWKQIPWEDACKFEKIVLHVFKLWMNAAGGFKCPCSVCFYRSR